MNTPLISIIVPVYNVEKYLEECLDSILSQSFADFELICVDDGSTDGSPEILRKYADRDDRIKIIAQANRGSGAARNAGMEAARGDYIVFIDSDDFIEPELLAKFARVISEHPKINLIEYRLNLYRDGMKIPDDWIDRGGSGIKRSDAEDIMRMTGVCGKVYNRQFLTDNNLANISERILMEEIQIAVAGYILAGEFYHLDFHGYNWRENPLSLSRSSANKKWAFDCAIKVAGMLFDKYGKPGGWMSVRLLGWKLNEPDDSCEHADFRAAAADFFRRMGLKRQDFRYPEDWSLYSRISSRNPVAENDGFNKKFMPKISNIFTKYKKYKRLWNAAILLLLLIIVLEIFSLIIK
jgi:glycosyltransferase involved in cell wall biosynthesis